MTHNFKTLLDVVPVGDDDVAALRVEVPEVCPVEAPAAVPASVLGGIIPLMTSAPRSKGGLVEMPDGVREGA